MQPETPQQRWDREAIEKRDCRKCEHCGWEPDSDLYCGHPVAFEKVSPFGATHNAMSRMGLCVVGTKQLWELRNANHE